MARIRLLFPLPSSSFAQSGICPSRSKQRRDPGKEMSIKPEPTMIEELLGQPLSIKEAASLIGCSPWTVRQKYVPLGLPHLRSGPNGKLIFYRNQIIRWLLERQQKGGSRT